MSKVASFPKVWFPQYPYNIGTDICHIPRIRRLLLRSSSWQLENKILNHVERVDWRDRFVVLEKMRKENTGARLSIPVDLQEDFNRAVQFLAGRWAGKEAVIKAHSSCNLSMHDITFVRRDLGGNKSPICYIPKSTGDEGVDPDLQVVNVNISHDGDYATAVCLSVDRQAKARARSAIERAISEARCISGEAETHDSSVELEAEVDGSDDLGNDCARDLHSDKESGQSSDTTSKKEQ